METHIYFNLKTVSCRSDQIISWNLHKKDESYLRYDGGRFFEGRYSSLLGDHSTRTTITEVYRFLAKSLSALTQKSSEKNKSHATFLSQYSRCVP